MMVVAKTFTATVQLAEDVTTVPRFAPDRDTELLPATAVMTPLEQVVVALGVGAIVKPEGSVSDMDIFVNSAAFMALVKVMVSRVTVPPTTVAGANAFDAVNGATTEIAAVAVAVLLPKDVCIPLTAIVFVCVPKVAAIAT